MKFKSPFPFNPIREDYKDYFLNEGKEVLEVAIKNVAKRKAKYTSNSIDYEFKKARMEALHSLLRTYYVCG